MIARLESPSDKVILDKVLPRYQNNYKKMTAIYNMVNLFENRMALMHKLPLPQPVVIFWGEDDQYFSYLLDASMFETSFVHSRHVKMYLVAKAGHLLLLKNQKVISGIAENYRAPSGTGKLEVGEQREASVIWEPKARELANEKEVTGTSVA